MSENTIKRFILFQGEYYYPAGGMADYGGTYDTLEEAVANVDADSLSWAHIIDHETLRYVWCDGRVTVRSLNQRQETGDARRAEKKAFVDSIGKPKGN